MYKLKNISATVFTMLLSLAIVSCEGDPGRDGINLVGDHAVVPTIELVHPMPPKEFNQTMFIEAVANDNSIIIEVEFLLNGNEIVTTMTQPPWALSLSLPDYVDIGTHYLQAIATDIYDRKALSSVVFFRRSNTIPSSRTDTLKYHIDGDLYGRKLPDPAGRITGFGTRFSPDFDPQIVAEDSSIWVEKLRFDIAHPVEDSSAYELYRGKDLFTLQLWTSKNGLPDSLMYSDIYSNTNGLTYEPKNVAYSITSKGHFVYLNREFIVTFTMDSIETVDTLTIVTDDGRWRNGHSLIRENGVWKEFRTNPYTSPNMIMEVEVQYGN